MTSARLTKGTHVLIADGEKALLLEAADVDGRSRLRIAAVARQEAPPEPSDRPGRFNDGPSIHRSAVEETDWQRLARERFAEDLADLLLGRVREGGIGRLVLVAPPPVLGALRGHLHRDVAEVVVAELDKTLTNHPLDEVERLIARALAA
jgi:protein required for attachment to host cells